MNKKFWTIVFIPRNYLNLILKESNPIYLKIFLVFVAPVYMSILVLMTLIKRNNKQTRKGLAASFVTSAEKINEWFKE